MAATSTSVFAAPYVGLEYGVTNMSHDYSTTFSDNVSLTPDDSSSAFGGFVGYRFNEFGLELGYKKFESDDSNSKRLSYVPPVETEREWNADLDATQFTLKPVYFHNFNEKLQLKIGLGLTYTQYKYDSSAYTETENDLTDQESISDYEHGTSKSESVFGAIASVGIEYMVIPNLALGASASYQVDNIANSSSFMLSSAYYF